MKKLQKFPMWTKNYNTTNWSLKVCVAILVIINNVFAIYHQQCLFSLGWRFLIKVFFSPFFLLIFFFFCSKLNRKYYVMWKNIIFISYSIFIICDFHHEDNSISQCIRRMSSFWQTDTWQLENPLTENYFVRLCFYIFFYGLMRL